MDGKTALWIANSNKLWLPRNFCLSHMLLNRQLLFNFFVHFRTLPSCQICSLQWQIERERECCMIWLVFGCCGCQILVKLCFFLNNVKRKKKKQKEAKMRWNMAKNIFRTLSKHILRPPLLDLFWKTKIFRTEKLRLGTFSICLSLSHFSFFLYLFLTFFMPKWGKSISRPALDYTASSRSITYSIIRWLCSGQILLLRQ